jgi:cation diffusion facilitator CzcD-associated flavoprotein CzcO
MISADANAPMAETEVLVIGAGPAGLAVAGCLRTLGLQPHLIEKADSVASSWQGHYQRLHLHTVKGHSALPHLPFPRDCPRYVPRQKMVDYLAAYARHFGLSPSFGEEAVAVARSGDAWDVACRSGRRFRARFVVVATGANRLPNLPAFAHQAEYRGRVMHSRAYRDPAPFAGQRVLVVGLGNTGAEIALDLAGQGVPVSVSVRSPVNLVHRDILGRPTQLTAILISRLPAWLGDALAKLLRDVTVGDLRPYGLQTSPVSPLRQLREEGRTPVIDVGTLALIKSGAIRVRPGIEAFTADGVRFTDGTGDAFDAVILATGYQPDVASLFPGTGVPLGVKDLPAQVVGTGALDGVFFVGFDVQQGGGMLRSIAMQATEVAEAIRARIESPGKALRTG